MQLQQRITRTTQITIEPVINYAPNSMHWHAWTFPQVILLCLLTSVPQNVHDTRLLNDQKEHKVTRNFLPTAPHAQDDTGTNNDNHEDESFNGRNDDA